MCLGCFVPPHPWGGPVGTGLALGPGTTSSHSPHLGDHSFSSPPLKRRYHETKKVTLTRSSQLMGISGPQRPLPHGTERGITEPEPSRDGEAHPPNTGARAYPSKKITDVVSTWPRVVFQGEPSLASVEPQKWCGQRGAVWARREHTGEPAVLGAERAPGNAHRPRGLLTAIPPAGDAIFPFHKRAPGSCRLHTAGEMPERVPVTPLGQLASPTSLRSQLVATPAKEA